MYLIKKQTLLKTKSVVLMNRFQKFSAITKNRALEALLLVMKITEKVLPENMRRWNPVT